MDSTEAFPESPRPTHAALARMEPGPPGGERKTPFPGLTMPGTRNWSPNVVFPVRKEPGAVTVGPRGPPPPRSSSRPSIPVSTIPFPAGSGAARSSAAASVILRDPLHVDDDEALLARDHRREPRDLVPPEVGQDARELLHVHVPLPVRAVRVRPPLEREAAVDAVDHHLLEPLLQDPAGEEEVRDPAPVLRRPLEPLDRRHEVPHLDRLRLHEVREAVDDDEGAPGVLVQERDEALEDVLLPGLERVLLAGPARGDDGVPEVRRAEVPEDREVPERGEELRVEGGPEFLEDRLRGAGERRVADPLR